MKKLTEEQVNLLNRVFDLTDAALALVKINRFGNNAEINNLAVGIEALRQLANSRCTVDEMFDALNALKKL